MTNTTFITVDNLKEFTPVTENMDYTTIQSFISVGEGLWIYDVLGTALTSSLLQMIENQTLSGDSLNLVTSYIVPAACWYTLYESSVFLIYRTENKGLTKKYSDNSQALDKQEFAIYRQSVLDKANYFRNRLIRFLDDNQSLYPLYRASGSCNNNSRMDFSGGIYV